MKKITRLWQLMLLLVLTSSVAFAQSYSLGTTAEVNTNKKSEQQLTEVQKKAMSVYTDISSTTAISNSVLNSKLDYLVSKGEIEMAKSLKASQSTQAKYDKVEIPMIKGKGPAYGYIAYDASSTNPVGPASLSLVDGTMASLAATTSTKFIAAGTWADGTWYGAEYYDSGAGQGGGWWTLDEVTGVMTLVSAGPNGFNGIAYDNIAGVMYACSSTDLYTVDKATGVATLIGAMGNAGGVMIGLAHDGATLYGVDLGDDNLYTIDVATGAATIVGPLGIDLNYAQDAEFDKDNGVLYLSAYTTTGQLYSVDVATGAASYIADFTGGAEVTSFAIPYTGVTYVNDLAAQAILDPSSGIDLSANEPVTVKVRNNGTASQSNFDVEYTFDGTTYTENVAGPLAAGATLDYTFATTVDLSVYGTYNIDACVNLVGDQNAANDCFSKSVENSPPSLCIDGLYSTGCAYGDGLTTWDLANVNVPLIECGNGDPYDWYHDWTGTYTHNVEQGVSYSLTAQAGYSNTYVRVWIDYNDNLAWDAGEMLVDNFFMADANVDYVIPIDIPLGATMGTHVLRYRTNWNSAMTGDGCEALSYGNVADFSVDIAAAPACLTPNALMESSITINSAVLAWTEVGTATAWDIEYGPTGFAPTGTPSFSTTHNPHTLNGLNSATTYDWYVRANCGGGDYSDWSAVSTFTTLCDLVIPAGAILESEACGDDLNGGCNMAAGTETWEPVNDGDIVHGTFWAFDDGSGGATRDTDWFEITISESSTITVTADAESPLAILEITTATQGVPDCASTAVGLSAVAGPCTEATFTTAVLPAGTYWFWAGSTSYDGFPCTQNYWIEFDVRPVYAVNGVLRYANSADTQLDHSMVTLTDATPMDYDYMTMCDGAFAFTENYDGDYTLTGSSDKEWGGLGLVDAIFTQRFLAGLMVLNPLQQLAADVSQSGAPSLVDVVMIKRRLAGLTFPAWSAPNYVFETYAITIAGVDLNQDVYGLCSGDVNGNYVPAATCNMPTNLWADEVSSTEYNLSWDGTGSSDLEWGPAGFALGTGTFVAGATSPYNLPGLTAGDSYDFYVMDYCCGGSSSSEWAGPFTFPPPPPANDDCANAEVIGEVVDYGFNTSYATTSGLDTHSVNQDIWYAYTPAVDGTIDVDLCGSSFDTKVVVYSGTCGALTELAYNDDDCGLQSGVSAIAVTAGQTYLIQVGGYGSNSGSGDLTITLY